MKETPANPYGIDDQVIRAIRFEVMNIIHRTNASAHDYARSEISQLSTLIAGLGEQNMRLELEVAQLKSRLALVERKELQN